MYCLLQTATSTIQQYLAKNSQAKEILSQMDHVALYTRVNSPIWADVSRLLLLMKDVPKQEDADDFVCSTTTISSSSSSSSTSQQALTTTNKKTKNLRGRRQLVSSSNRNSHPPSPKHDTCWMEYIKQTKEWKLFVNSMQQDRQDNKHILWSDETLFGTQRFDEKLMLLKEVFYDQNNYEIEVVVTYRRYYDFVISLYNQNMKLFPKKIVDNTDHYIQSFVDWYATHGKSWSLQNTLLLSNNNNNNTISSTTSTTTDTTMLGMSLIKTILPKQTPIRIFNMYTDNEDDEEQPDLVTRFVCFLGNDITGNLCQSMLSTFEEEKTNNKKSSTTATTTTTATMNAHTDTLDSQYIVQRSLLDALEERKTISTTSSRNWTRHEISLATMELTQHVEELKASFLNNNRTLPVQCISSEDLQDMYDLSVELEQSLVPSYYDQHKLQVDFAAAVANNKFCSVDYERLLSKYKSTWKIFLTNLVTTYIQSKEEEEVHSTTTT